MWQAPMVVLYFYIILTVDPNSSAELRGYI